MFVGVVAASHILVIYRHSCAKNSARVFIQLKGRNLFARASIPNMQRWVLSFLARHNDGAVFGDAQRKDVVAVAT